MHEEDDNSVKMIPDLTICKVKRHSHVPEYWSELIKETIEEEDDTHIGIHSQPSIVQDLPLIV